MVLNGDRSNKSLRVIREGMGESFEEECTAGKIVREIIFVNESIGVVFLLDVKGTNKQTSIRGTLQ